MHIIDDDDDNDKDDDDESNDLSDDDPDFKDVFHSKSPILAFWEKHKILFTVPKKPQINNPKVHVIS